jgi:hypothetical protein
MSLFAETRIPVCRNAASSATILEISDTFFSSSLLSLHHINVCSLFRFAIDAAEAYVNDANISDIIDVLFDEYSEVLPVCSNTPTLQQVIEMVTEVSFFQIQTFVDLNVLSCIYPLERRINFRFPPFTATFLSQNLSTLPISANICTFSMSLQILIGLGPLHFFGFPLTDCAPLLFALEAPEEITEALDIVVNRLINLILSQDVTPVLPIWEDVSDDIANAIAESTFAESDALAKVTILDVDFLTQIRPTDIPPFVTSEEVVVHLLYTRVLSKISFQRIVRDLGDDVEELLARGIAPRFPGEELSNPRVEAMLRRYIKRSNDQHKGSG